MTQADFFTGERNPVGEASEVLERAVLEHDPSRVFSMFSGGRDSIASAYLTSMHPNFSGCIHIDTRTGITETREYVMETCRQMGWPLTILQARDGEYEENVMEYGFPGASAHHNMFWLLKRKPLQGHIGMYKRSRRDSVALVTGARSSESKRRSQTQVGKLFVRRRGVELWVNPLRSWTAVERDDFIEKQGLPVNPVTQLLHRSGECLCGAMADPEEIKDIALFFPEVGAHIHDLERRVQAAGHRNCRWGRKQPTTARAQPLPQLFSDEEMELCTSCNINQEEA